MKPKIMTTLATYDRQQFTGDLCWRGYLRAGNLVAYVPEPVINGFAIGVAIIIASSQIKDLCGLSIAQVPAEFVAED